MDKETFGKIEIEKYKTDFTVKRLLCFFNH